MKTWLMVFFASLVLGVAFTGSSYFVTREEDEVLACGLDVNISAPESTQYNTYKETKNGFPFAFYTKDSAPKEGGCESIDKAHASGVEHSSFSKIDFAKDVATWSVVFLVLGGLVFGVGAKKKS
jgi:hypothetical protein